MTLDRELRIVAIHARAIVAHAHEPPPTILDIDVDRGRTRVERILQQLLHDRCWTFDHLTRRDLVRDVTRQHRYPRHVISNVRFILRC